MTDAGRRIAGRMTRMAGAVAVVGAVTALDLRVSHANSATVALTLLLAVLGIATWWGLPESLTASLAGMLCFNYYFLPPVGAWTIADPQNWVALFAFVVTAVVASQLSARAKRRAAEATSRQREMERLYRLSRSLLSMDPRSPYAHQIAVHIAEVFGCPVVEVHDLATGEVDRAGDAGAGGELAEWPLRLGESVLGALRLPRATGSETAIRAVAQLAAAALERAHAQEAASRAEAARQSEELKSVMLDALAHEFKTPLTSVKAAVTSLLNDRTAPAGRRELLQIVDEEADRLTWMVTEAIRIARIEAGEIEMHKAPQRIGDLIRESVAKLAGRLESRRIEVRVANDLPAAAADAELVGIVIRQLVDNAAKYSPPGSPIRVEAAREGESIVVGVADRGPGIAAPEQSRVFEKFYRGREARERIPGSGMGLAIAREIIRAHCGEIWVESRPGQGSEFRFSLPLASDQGPA